MLVWFIRNALTLAAIGLAVGHQCAGAECDEFSAAYDQWLVAYSENIDQVARQALDAGESEFANLLKDLSRPRDPHRQQFFVPGDSPRLNWDPRPRDPEWLLRAANVQVQAAAQLYELAKATAAAGHEQQAFRWLHEVCSLDPNHSAARNVLGYRLIDDRWRLRATVLDSRIARSRHAFLPWTGGQYRLVRSANYEIASTADEQQMIEVAELLERWRVVWNQAFYDYWAVSGSLAARLTDESFGSQTGRRMDIVLFRNRDEYIAELSNLGVVGVEHSTGYYNDQHRIMFFYLADPLPKETWLQEQAHQLFQESASARKDPVERSHVWVLEGLGMYFESLVDHGRFCTLGGFDATRLQFARIRWTREGKFVPLDELTALGREAFQSHPQVGELYSQAGGLVHFLIDFDSGKYRSPVIELAKEVYARRATADSLSTLCDRSYPELEREYQAWLPVDADEVAFLSRADERTALALGFSDIDSTIGATLSRCHQLRWLQLSATGVDDAIGPAISQMPNLRQLLLDQTRVTDQLLRSLEPLAELEELDLAGTLVTDDGIAALAKLPKLKYLWLGSTRVTDAGAAQLEKIQQLEMLDISNTAISDEARARLKKQIPLVR